MAGIFAYRGAEIGLYWELGLDPDKVCRLLHRPDELEKAVPTFNAAPLVRDHTSDVVGVTGSTAAFASPFLRNSLVIWSPDAIAGGRAELSAEYEFDLDIRPGQFKGGKYDAVARDIACLQIALVTLGRCGPECRVDLGEPLAARGRMLTMPYTVESSDAVGTT